MHPFILLINSRSNSNNAHINLRINSYSCWSNRNLVPIKMIYPNTVKVSFRGIKIYFAGYYEFNLPLNIVEILIK